MDKDIMKKMAYILPVLAGCLWGANGFFVRGLSEYGANSTTILAARLSVAILILFLIILVKDRSQFKIALRDIPIVCSVGILGVFGLTVCYNIAINELTLSFAAVLLALAPVFVIPMSAIIYKEKITLRKVICIIMALVGCVFLSGALEPHAGIPLTLYGFGVGLLSAFFNALLFILTKEAAKRGYHPMTISFYSFIAALVILAVLPLVDWSLIVRFAGESSSNIFFLIAMALCLGILPYIFFNESLRYIEAGRASILATSEPVAAAILGAILYHEIPTVLTLSGMIISCAALIILCLPEKEKK